MRKYQSILIKHTGWQKQVYWSLGTAVAKCQRLGGLNNRNLLSHISSVQNSESKALAELVSPGAFLLGSQMAAAFLLCPHMVFALCLSVSQSFLLTHQPVPLDQLLPICPPFAVITLLLMHSI